MATKARKFGGIEAEAELSKDPKIVSYLDVNKYFFPFFLAS